MSLWDSIAHFFGAANNASPETAANAYALASTASSAPSALHGGRAQTYDAPDLKDALEFHAADLMNKVQQVPVIGQVLEADRYVYSHAIAHPLATLTTGFGDFTRQLKDQSQGMGLIDAQNKNMKSIGQTWEDTQNTSPGQGFAYSVVPDAPRPTTPEALKQYHSNNLLKVVSGAADAYVNWKTDPLVLAGKGLGAARAKATYDFTNPADRQLAVNQLAEDSDRIAQGLDPQHAISHRVATLQGRDVAVNLQDSFVRHSDNPELVAHAFSLSTNFDEASTVAKTLWGDASARNLLKQQAPYIDNMLERSQGILRNPELKLDDPAHYAEVEALVTDLTKRSRTFQQLITADRPIAEGGSKLKPIALAQARAAVGRADVKYGKSGLWQDETFQVSKWGYPIRVIKWLGNERPAGLLGIGSDSFIKSADEMTAYAGHVSVWDFETRKAVTAMWAKTVDPRERIQLAHTIQHKALSDTARSIHPEWDQAEVTKWVDAYLQQHSNATERAMALAKATDGPLFGVDDAGATVLDPEFMSQLGSSIPTADVGMFAKEIRNRTPGMHPQIAYDAFVRKVDALYQIWRPAVLWHAGFTWKQAIAEPNLRAMAYINGRVWTDPLLLGRPSRTAVGHLGYNLYQRGAEKLRPFAAGRRAIGAKVVESKVAINDAEYALKRSRQEVRWFHEHASNSGPYEAVDSEWFTHAHQAAKDEVAVVQSHLDELRAHHDNLLTTAAGFTVRKRRHMGTEGKTVHGHYVPGPAEGSLGQIYRDLSSAEGTVQNTLVGPAMQRLQSQRLAAGWAEITPHEPHYFDELADRLNKQYRSQIPLRMIAGGADHAEMTKWLRSAKGKNYMRSLGVDPADADSFYLHMVDRVDQYTQGDAALLEKLAKDEPITSDFVAARLQGRKDLSPVHGHPTEFDFGYHEYLGNQAKNLRNWVYHKIGTLPENRMSRHPFYDRLYKDYLAEALPRRAADAGGWEKLNQTVIDDVVRAAHRHALKETLETIYTISRYSNIAAALRWASPFLQATLNQVEVWGRLFAKHPDVLAHYLQAMQIPQHVGNLKDSEGKDTGNSWDASASMTFQVPEAVSKIPFLRVLGNQSSFQISPHSVDPILQGEPWYSPGAGPVVGMVASEAIKQQPRLDQVMQQLTGHSAPDLEGVFKRTGILPYGGSRAPLSYDVWFSSDMKAAYTLFRHQDSQTYANQVAAIYQAQVLDNKVNGGPPPDMKLAVAQANQFFVIRLASSMFSPAPVQFDSKYAAAINDYHQMQQEDPQGAADKFLAKWGTDWADAMLSLSSNDYSVTPNRQTVDQLKKYHDLIAGHSDIDPSMVGAMFNQPGGFSQMAYNWELTNSPKYASLDNYRGKNDVQEAQAKLEAGVTWGEYIKYTNTLDAIKAARGLAPSAPLPPDLQYAKNAWVAAHQYTEDKKGLSAWYLDYSQHDDAASLKRVLFMQDVLNDPQWSRDHGSDPKWLAAAQWLQMRSSVSMMLQARDPLPGGSADITAKSNADLYYAWSAFNNSLAGSNTDWADMYHRYFENDSLLPLPPGVK